MNFQGVLDTLSIEGELEYAGSPQNSRKRSRKVNKAKWKVEKKLASNLEKRIWAYKIKHADNLFQIIRNCRIIIIFQIDPEILKP